MAKYVKCSSGGVCSAWVCFRTQKCELELQGFAAPLPATPAEQRERAALNALRKNWSRRCDNCEQTPTVGKSGLCGPCYFGEADTANGEW
jgi:hypothetical protein